MQQSGIGDAQRQPRTVAGVLSTFETCIQPESSSDAEVFGTGGILLLRSATNKCGVTANNRCTQLKMGDVLCLYASDEYFYGMLMGELARHSGIVWYTVRLQAHLAGCPMHDE